MCPKNQNSREGFSKALLRPGEGATRFVVANFLVSKSFVLAAVLGGQVLMFL